MHPTGPAALDTPTRTGRRLLFAVPWVLAAGLALAGAPTGRSGEPQDASIGVVPAPADRAQDTAAVASRAVAPALPTAAAPAGPLLPPALVADVLATARAVFGTAGLVRTSEGPHDTRWPLETHVVRVDRVTDQLAIATVHGLVLDRDGDGWTGPHLRAAAVPLSLTTEPAVAGPGWPLTRAAAVTTRAPRAVPLTDPGDVTDVTAALAGAGWTVEAITGLSDLGEDVTAVTFIGRHADEPATAAHTLWLHRTPERSTTLPSSTASHDVPTGEETP